MSFRTQIGPLNAKAVGREDGAPTLRDFAPLGGGDMVQEKARESYLLGG